MLVADLRRDFVRTWFNPLERASFEEMERIYDAMEADGKRALEKDVANRGKIIITRAADIRYSGQEHSVTVELSAKLLLKRDRAGIKKRFDEVHAQRYGYSSPKDPAEIVSLHSSVIGSLEKPTPKPLPRKASRTRPAQHRKVYFAERKGFVNTPVYARSDLPAGFKVNGPALVEEYASTTVVFPGDKLVVGKFGDLIITIDRR